MKKYTKKSGSTKKPNGFWKDKVQCVEESRKHKTIREWQLSSPGSLCAAYKYDWMNECTSHMESNKTPTLTVGNDRIRPLEKSLQQRMEAEKNVLEFLGMGKKVMFFQDDV